MQNRSARNNLLAGLFVISSLLLAVVVAFVLAERGAGAGALRFVVRFPISQGAAGLQRGSPVLLGGQQVGQVLEARVASRASQGEGTMDGPPDVIDVRVEVRRGIALYEDAIIALDRPLLGSLSSINISNAGVGGSPVHLGQTARIEQGEVIDAVNAPGMLAQLGIGPEQLEQLKRTLASVDASMARISKLVDSSSPDVEAAVADARALVADARTSFGQWSGRVDATLSNAETASARLDPLFTKAEASIDAATKVFEDARAIVSDNRERIEAILARVQSVADKLDAESIALLNDALRSARGAMAQAQQAVSDVEALLAEQRPNIRTGLANFRLTSDQLKLTAIEVRSQPWRLLVQPDTKEFESQILYDAARSYAQAASDVRAAAESISELTLTQRTSPSLSDAQFSQRLGELGQQLSGSMQSFQRVEKHLMDTLIREQR